MKPFLKLVGALSIWELCGRFPVTAGILTLLGVGGAVVASGALTPPSITPQASVNFGTQTYGVGNNILRPNAGGSGPAAFPSTPTASFFIGVEGSVDPSLSAFEYALGDSVAGNTLILNGLANGAPTFIVGRTFGWWEALSPMTWGGGNPGISAGSNYLQAFLPWTATGGGCTREPSGITGPNTSGTTVASMADYGFQCSTTPTSVSMTTIPNNAAQQVATITGCTSSTPSGEAQVTVTVPIAHGITPAVIPSGSGITIAGFTSPNTAFNQTNYIPTQGTAGTTLVLESPLGTSGVCPGGVTYPVTGGKVLSGTGGSVSLSGISTSNPFGTNQSTGITTKQGAKFCGVIGEYGADSPTPGFQFAAFSDWNGTALTNSPALSTWPNMGATNFTGYTVTGTQSPSSPALAVTAMNSYAISGATWNNSTSVTFTFSTNPNLWLGSEFTVSGASPSGYNGTYIVAAGTTPNTATVIATPLAAPLGNVQSLANPGSYVSGASAVGVIVPGMNLWGASANESIMPFGVFGGTGTGGAGTYALSGNQVATKTFTASISGTTMTVTGVPGLNLAIGEGFSGTSVTGSPVITAYGTGTGGAGTYTISVSQGTIGSETMTASGTLGSSGSPVSLFASAGFYYTITATSSSSTTVGVLTAKSSSTIGDFFSYIGGYNTIGQFTGWGGSLANIGMYYGIFPESANQPSQTALASTCQKTTDYQSFASANSLTVHSLYRLNDPGIWADSGVAQFTGSISGTALTISSTQSGSTSALPVGTVIAGAGVTGCQAACPAISSGSGSSYVLSASGGTVSSEPMTAGAYKPALPVAQNGFNGYISGNSLTVTSIATANKATFTATLGYPTNSFVGHIDNGVATGTTGNVLTVTTAPTAPFVTTMLAGVQVCWSGSPSPCPYIISLGSGGGGTGTYYLDQSISGGVPASTSFTGTVTTMTGGESQILTPVYLNISAVSSGTVATKMLITDGGVHITGQPLQIVQPGTVGSSPYTVAPNYYPTIGTGETMYGVSTTLAPGEYVRDDVNHTVTTPIKIIGYGTGANAPGLCATGEWGCGTYTILNPGSLTIGSSGSPAAFTASGVTDGAAIAPGPALSIKDPGPGVTFPVTNYGAGTGTLFLSGEYNTASLGGTPTAIQAQVSYTAGGPPISGCPACAWATLSSGTISGGKWTGQALNIPGGGPYYVSVRAANGTSYATMPSAIKVGIVLDIWGVGQAQPVITPSNGGWAFSTYPGLGGVNAPWVGNYYYYTAGPSVLGPNLFPSYAQMIGVDQPAVVGSPLYLAEGQRYLGVNLQNAMGYPVTVDNWTRDGAAIGVFSYDGIAATQGVGIGDGSTTTFCSEAVYCAKVSPSGVLDNNLAAMTGSLITASISGTTLTVSGITTGALQPGAVLSDSFTGGGNHIVGSPTLVNCTANCGGIGGATSVWTISSSQSTITSEAMRADPPGGAPAPLYNPQYGNSVFSVGIVKAGTFSVSVNGAVVCTDPTTYPNYAAQGGNCVGAGVSSAFVNYITGDYQIIFSTPPANGAVINASWVTIDAPGPTTSSINATNNLSYVGTGTETSGFMSSIFNRTPGGSSAHILAGCITDNTTAWETGFPTGGVGWAQMINWFYGVKIPSIFTGSNAIPYMSPSTPLVSANNWRGDGMPGYLSTDSQFAYNSLCDEWAVDLTVQSTFSGTIRSVSGTGPSTATLTLSAAATGTMWEGEIIGCSPFSLTCVVPTGTYITGLLSGTWGASGSTYGLANQTSAPISTVSSATTMANQIYYSQGPSIYAGAMNDSAVVPSTSGINGTDGFAPHPTFGLAGAPRIGRKWAAEIYGGLTGNAAPPTLDRIKADAVGCDTSALAGPCFDIGNTYAASATGAISGSTVTITGGLAAHGRPFVPGMALSCPGCTAGRFITSVSRPPTQSTATGAGQVGQTFTITANGSLGVSTTETVTGGCSGTEGTGSNCIDIAFSINTGGTYGTAAGLATCGENSLNGVAPPYTVPMGYCSSNGVGSLVRNFRIGTQQITWGGTTPSQLGSPGDPYDDGVDPWTPGGFNQSSAFTCNIVAAKVVQCVKGAAYSSGVLSGIGQWASGSTFIEYGDTVVGTGRGNSLVGNVGGQPFGFTAGSGYTAGVYTIPASNCINSTGTHIFPKVDVTVGSGGGIVDVYGSTVGSAIGEAVGNGCTFSLNAAFTGTVSGSTLTVSALSSGGLASGMSIAGSGVSGVLSSCSAGCTGNPIPSPANPSTTGTPQTWSLTGASGSATNASLTASWASMGAGTGGAVTNPAIQPTDGVWGIATQNDSATLMGDELYDNSGLVGNPMHSFFDNGMGGYFEPGLPVRPFGLFLGAAVSG